MSWFTVDVMAIVNHYNQMCDASTLGSKFEVGNKACMEKLQKDNLFFEGT
jgi:hypothetical protein